MTSHDNALDVRNGKVGDQISAAVGRWTFGEGVYRTFDDHISRSVPQYSEGHALVLALSDFFIRAGGVAYELGCSTGTLTRQIAERHADRSVRVIGVDIEAEMIGEAARRCSDTPNATLVVGDVRDIRFEPCDFVVSYYTLQFLSRPARLRVVRSIADALPMGGAFVMFEKVREPDSQLQDTMQQLYADFKLSHGFSAAEVLAKSRSLRAVLEPQTSLENTRLLEAGGFATARLVHKSLLFEGYLAVK
jgi:tRNA (cmo5U34)-methyltransferase